MISNRQNPVISIILPVYNAEHTINAAVSSILNQSYPHFELIIIDDGSTDTSQLELSKFKSDNRVSVHTTKNNGITAALNYGLELAGGEFIARMDADDISLPHRLKAQIDFFNKHPKIDVLSTSYYIFEDSTNGHRIIKKIIHPIGPTVVHWMLKYYCVITHPAVMFRRSVIDDGKRYPMSVAEDLEFWRLISNGSNISNLPEAHLLYRRSHGSLSSKNSQLIYRTTRISSFNPPKPTLLDLIRDLRCIKGINKIGIILRWLND